MEKIEIEGTPFGVLMQQAAQLKTAQNAVLRTKFDKWPRFYQNSMFLRPEYSSAREKCFDERMDAALCLKEEGNGKFNQGNVMEASFLYENALAIFKFARNTDEGWKKKGIKDDDIEEIDFVGETNDEKIAIKQFKIQCYLNLCLCYFRMREFGVSIQACDEVLELDPQNAKAYFRKAKARIAPASSGATELDIAIEDLKRAKECDPDDSVIKRELSRCIKLRKEQKLKDKTTFTGVFQKGSLSTDDDDGSGGNKEKSGVYHQRAQPIDGSAGAPPSNEASASVPGALTPEVREHNARLIQIKQQIDAAEQVLKVYEESGRVQEAEEMRISVEKAKQKFMETEARGLAPHGQGTGYGSGQYREPVDFRRPTQEMLERAKADGIDLTDPGVVQMLEELQREEMEKAGGAAKRATTTTTKKKKKGGGARRSSGVDGARMLGEVTDENDLGKFSENDGDEEDEEDEEEEEGEGKEREGEDMDVTDLDLGYVRDVINKMDRQSLLTLLQEREGGMNGDNQGSNSSNGSSDSAGGGMKIDPNWDDETLRSVAMDVTLRDIREIQDYQKKHGKVNTSTKPGTPAGSTVDRQDRHTTDQAKDGATGKRGSWWATVAITAAFFTFRFYRRGYLNLPLQLLANQMDAFGGLGSDMAPLVRWLGSVNVGGQVPGSGAAIAVDPTAVAANGGASPASLAGGIGEEEDGGGFGSGGSAPARSSFGLEADWSDEAFEEDPLGNEL